MQKKSNLYFVCAFYFVLFISCNKEEPIPAYVHIDKFVLTTNYANQGSASHKILDAWIYIDDQLVGAFELPCTIPVLYEGSHIVKILAGIKENGISETRIPYPFYERYEETVSFVAGEITVFNPTAIYSQAADFTWFEDFEGASHSICTATGNQDTIMKMNMSPAEVFELTGSGEVSITSGSYFGITCDKFTLPKAGAPVFLEVNYNCNTDFNIGLVGYGAGGGIEMQNIAISLRPTEGWNKIYVNLTDDVSGALSSANFSVFFSMLKDTDLSTSYFYLDNVKLIN